MTDKNGVIITRGMLVIVPDPSEKYKDEHQHSFQGEVFGFHGQYVTVTDADNLCWDIEPERLEVTREL